MATSKLIQWLPEIVQATDEDILRYGPQAAQVRTLLDFIPGMSERAHYISRNAVKDAAWDAAWDAADRATYDAARVDAWDDAAEDAFDVGAEATGYAESGSVAMSAALAELVNDLIDPQDYRILTDRLNAGRVYDLRLPDAGSEFMRLVDKLRPKNVDEIERLADLSVDPRAQGIIEFLQGLQGGMPLAAKIDAARRLDRASRAGRRLS